MNYSPEFFAAAQQLINAGHFIDQKGWVPATSGNFSARLPDGTIAITVSGKHKGHLTPDDIMLIDAEANSLDGKKPSAETLLHTSLYQHFPAANAVLHPHSLNATLISKLFTSNVTLENYELLKALPDIDTHESTVVIPIFENDQTISRLAACVSRYLEHNTPVYAYLIAGHGLYTWGASVQDSLRYLEALDFLFECELRLPRVNNQ
jgi:methylthioribulose-1-phosphate dehydratase